MCYPKAFPAALTLSSTDVSAHDEQWHCDELNVLDLLQEGERLTYDVAKTLYWLSQDVG